MGLRLADVRALADGIENLAIWLRRQVPQTVSASTVGALGRLHREGPLRVSELATREGISQPGVTVLIHRLSEAGWAERVPDPTDRRAALVRITPAGVTLLDERQALRAQILRDAVAGLPDTDRDVLLAALPAIERLVAANHRSTTDPQEVTK